MRKRFEKKNKVINMYTGKGGSKAADLQSKPDEISHDTVGSKANMEASNSDAS